MTLHIRYEHLCEKCKAYYIPYDADVPCPRCGAIEAERFDYIEQGVESLRFNRREGAYTPGAWYVGSLGDHILSLIFPVFDANEEEHPEDFNEFAAKWFSEMDWGDQTYLRDHVTQIAIRLNEELNR